VGQSGFDFWASTSGLRLPSAVRHAITVMARDDPALGFASCRVDGHMTVHPNDLEDRFGSPASGAPRPVRFSPAAQLQSAHGFKATPSQHDQRMPTGSEGFAREGHIPVTRYAGDPKPKCRAPARFRRPFSVLMGLMPCYTRRLRGPPGKLPV
jgi:hypothetical protein